MVENDSPTVDSPLLRQLAAVRRYWWVVLLVVALALIGAGVSTARTPTTYVGRTSLIVSSNNRSPDQDAVLVQGYVTYFDDAAYQRQILAEARVDPGASVEAQAAAASPILVVSLTSTDPQRAQADAIAVARAFRDDINAVHARSTAAELASLQDRLDTAVARRNKADDALISSLQERIRELQDDSVNVLQDLQANGGVAVQSPPWFSNLLLGLAGGLVAGTLLALALARLSPRLRSRSEVADKIGLAPLVELPGPRARDAALVREQRVRQLANVLQCRFSGLGAVFVTQVGGGAASWMVARELALEWSVQGYPTALVRLGDGSPGRHPGGSASEQVRAVDARTALSQLQVDVVPKLAVLDLVSQEGPQVTLSASEVIELLRAEPFAGARVVLQAPDAVDSAVAQAVNRVADATVLVLDPGTAKAAEAREAVRVLRQPGTGFLGAVLAPTGDDSGRDDRASLGNGVRTGQDGTESTYDAGWSWWPTRTPSTSQARDSGASDESDDVPVSTNGSTPQAAAGPQTLGARPSFAEPEVAADR